MATGCAIRGIELIVVINLGVKTRIVQLLLQHLNSSILISKSGVKDRRF
jgi:hypothetical protein